MPSKARRSRAKKLTRAQLEQTYRELGTPPKDARDLHEWFARASALLCHEALTDFGSTNANRERRRHAMQLLRWAIDTLPAAKLAAELRELYERLKQDEDDAAAQPSGDAAVRTSKASQH